MRRRQATPEVRAAIFRGAVIELLLIAGGAGLYTSGHSVLWLAASVFLGGAVMLIFVAQAGGFKRDDG